MYFNFKKAMTVLFIILPLTAFAGDLIKKPSASSVNETMDKLENLVKSKGMTVFARINHAKNADSVNMKMNKAEVLIFGNPKGGSVLMQNDPSIALDLPLRIAIYEDNEGKVWLIYHDPQSFMNTYHVGQGEKVINKVQAGLDKLSSAVTQ